jgi:hypothetical protein
MHRDSRGIRVYEGVALGGRTYGAEAFIQNGNDFCGANEPGAAVVGVVTFHRTGNVVRFAFDVERGTPDAEYDALVLENSPIFCYEIFRIAFTTNNRGEGHFTGEVTVEADATALFADAYNPARGGDTTTVTLP